MNLILKNFISIFRRFKLAVILNVLGLSVAFAAFMVIMMQLDYDLNFDRFHPDSDRICRLEISEDKEVGVYWVPISRPFGELFAESSSSVADYTFTYTESMNEDFFFSVENNNESRNFTEKTLSVTSNYPEFFSFDMLEGDIHALKEPGKAIIPLSLAQKMFGKESAIDKQLKGREQSYIVGGVYSDFPRNSSVLNSIYTAIPDDFSVDDWGYWAFYFFLKLTENSSPEQVVESFKSSTTLPEHDIDSWESATEDIRLNPLAEIRYTNDTMFDSTPKGSRQTEFLLFCIAITIILISAINFMNLSTALAPVRIKSVNTQKILGGNNSVIRLSLISEAIGITLIAFFIALALVFIASDTPIANLVDADISLKRQPLLIAVTGLIAGVTGLAAGLYPAFYITSFQPAMVLKGNFGLSPKGRKLRNVLVGIQFCASFALIIGASFMYLQNRFMQQMPLGYDKDTLIITDTSKGLMDNREALKNELLSFSEIEGVSYANFILSSSEDYGSWGRDYRGQSIDFECLFTDTAFPDIIGVKIEEGRGFMKEDSEKGAFIFNESARRAFDLELGEPVGGLSVVGFMSDINYASLRTGIAPMAFYADNDISDNLDYAYIKVKAGTNIRAAKKQVEAALKKFDPEYTFNVRFFDDVLNATYEKELRINAQITLAGLIAILISIVGVFGIALFESEFRRKEIGIRKVFGASMKEILLLFNKTYIRILCGCFVLAAPAAWYAVDKWLENFAYKTPMYWWVYLLAFIAVLVVTVGAVTFQCWRTASANPIDGIRAE